MSRRTLGAAVLGAGITAVVAGVVVVAMGIGTSRKAGSFDHLAAPSITLEYDADTNPLVFTLSLFADDRVVDNQPGVSHRRLRHEHPITARLLTKLAASAARLGLMTGPASIDGGDRNTGTALITIGKRTIGDNFAVSTRSRHFEKLYGLIVAASGVRFCHPFKSHQVPPDERTPQPEVPCSRALSRARGTGCFGCPPIGFVGGS